MLEYMRLKLLELLLVPPEPQPPDGTPESILIFRAGRNFYNFQLLKWAAASATSFLGVAFGLAAGLLATRRAPSWVPALYIGIAAVLFLAIALTSFASYLSISWNYKLRWYIVTDRSLRIRRGIWNVEELTMTFANIQEIRVSSGPIQMFLGIADVEVHAAGGGSTTEHGERRAHKASFEGVDNANEIRDRIVERLRIYRDMGLGTEHSQAETHTTTVIEAAHHVLGEARALRNALQK